uniref:Uncharacterized protein n=1 Tax=Peronospora matthiolae TaxID=2874970 RepID=A0AAV1UBY7_9STRA
MEPNTQYALHDSEATPPVWAARVRLTPELLHKLRQDPERVLLQLNVFTNVGSSKSRDSKKKTSLMTLDLAGTKERYELLSFSEDPGINHVCTFRRPAEKELERGYSIYKTGEIYQKLLVQRLLDDTEKDRIKDKHAKSVQESKSRTSKMIDSKMQQNNAKRQRRRTTLSSVSVATTTSSAAGVLKRKLLLPSALSTKEAKDAKEKIERGFVVEVEAEEEKLTQEQNTMSVQTKINDKATASANDVESHALFSSNSSDEDSKVNSERRVLKKQKTRVATTSKNDRNVLAAKGAKLTEDRSIATTGDDATTGRDKDAKACQVKLSNATSKGGATVKPSNTKQGTQKGRAVDIHAVKPIKPSSSGVEVKRARMRSTLVSDRVKQAQQPDMSSYPYSVGEICQRVAHHRGRSVILDKSDYDVFVKTHEQFLQDWEMLDKIYSIEMIKTEGLHLQLEVATDDSKVAELEARIQAAANKKEGLLFVRDAMISIQKILLSIQTSIERFDLKPHASQNTSTRVSTSQRRRTGS